MADENIQRPPEHFAATAPTHASSDGITPHVPSARAHGGVLGRGRAVSEIELSIRWFIGLVAVLIMGWGLVFLAYWTARKVGFELDLSAAALVASPVSLFIFWLAEKNLWLSRFMGLRLGPSSSRLKETLFLWLLGVPGLMFRSTLGPSYSPTLTTAEPKRGERGDRPRTPTGEADGLREIVETVVFVVVLVLLLKTFLAEAFVIPTGSMATTLLGYHREIECPSCRYRFPLNFSSEADPQPPNRPTEVEAGTCPNCRLRFDLQRRPAR
jgi:hypothetical protein